MFARYLLIVLSNHTDGTPHRLLKKRTIQRRSEPMEKAAHGVRTGDPCDGARIHTKQWLEITRSEDDSGREQSDPDAGGTGEKVWGNNKYDNQ